MTTEQMFNGAVIIFTASALWNFIQFLIVRHDDKKSDISAIKSAIDKLAEKIAENQAILARTHILRFDDELLNDVKHSKEYFSQQLQDIDTYEAYCAAHPDFKNSYAVCAIEHIRKTYAKLLDEHKI